MIPLASNNKDSVQVQQREAIGPLRTPVACSKRSWNVEIQQQDLRTTKNPCVYSLESGAQRKFPQQINGGIK